MGLHSYRRGWILKKCKDSFTILSNMRRVITINQKNAKHVSHEQSQKRLMTAMKITWLGPQQLGLCCHSSILTQRKPPTGSKIAYLKSM